MGSQLWKEYPTKIPACKIHSSVSDQLPRAFAGPYGIKNAERNINNLRYADNTTLMAESEEELKSLLMKVK